MRKSKNRYFYHIFVSPGDAPGAITLNFVWMEREFDAYKLSRCMCPSNYNRFWDRARIGRKSSIFSYPLAFVAPVRGVPVGVATPCGMEKLDWLGYHMVKKFRRYLIYIFIRFGATHERDRQTDGHRVPAVAALCTAKMFCQLGSLSNATFSFLITWCSSSSKDADVYKISSKVDDFYRATRIYSADNAVARCLSVRLSHAGIEPKRLQTSSKFFTMG